MSPRSARLKRFLWPLLCRKRLVRTNYRFWYALVIPIREIRTEGSSHFITFFILLLPPKSELAEGRHPTTFHLLDYMILEQPDEDGHRWDIFYLFSDLEIGNLSRMLAEHRRDGTMIAEGDVIRIAIDLVDALTFLHGCQPPLLHRNIRPSSVIQTSSGVFKFSSFMSAGFPKVLDLLADHLVAEDLECYTDPRYRSPEMIGEETQLGRNPSECTAESGAVTAADPLIGNDLTCTLI